MEQPARRYNIGAIVREANGMEHGRKNSESKLFNILDTLYLEEGESGTHWKCKF